MIYFLYNSYEPDTALTNRALSYFRSIEAMKVGITVVFFMPDKNKSQLTDDFQYINVKYYWSRYFVNNRYIKNLCYYSYLLHFKASLKEGDIVYIYGSNDILKKLIDVKGVRFFLEITECPEVYMLSSILYRPSLNEHFGLCKKLTGLIVISDALKQYYIAHGVEKDRIHVVNMTVDNTRFDNLLKQKHSDNYIAYCGAASNNKDGVDILLSAFALIHKKHSNIKLYIIGEVLSSTDQSKNSDIIRDNHLEDSVVFTGRVNADMIPQTLVNAQILALARPDNLQAKYGFPTKLGEYLLSCNPVVFTAVGDILRFLKDGESALICEPNNPKAFADKSIWAIEHCEESHKIGFNGSLVAKSQFNSKIETKKLINIINFDYSS